MFHQIEFPAFLFHLLQKAAKQVNCVYKGLLFVKMSDGKPLPGTRYPEQSNDPFCLTGKDTIMVQIGPIRQKTFVKQIIPE